MSQHLKKFRDAVPTYRTIIGALTPEECRRIVELNANCPEHKRSQLYLKSSERQVRDSHIFWLRSDTKIEWLYERFHYLVRELNSNYFEYELDGKDKTFQLTRYDVGDYYSWHVDLGAGPTSRRKLSMTIQLSDPGDYDGSELQFFFSEQNIPVAHKEQGSMTVFPSWMTHQVAPTKSGTRWSLVGWFEGPPFR